MADVIDPAIGDWKRTTGFDSTPTQPPAGGILLIHTPAMRQPRFDFEHELYTHVIPTDAVRAGDAGGTAAGHAGTPLPRSGDRFSAMQHADPFANDGLEWSDTPFSARGARRGTAAHRAAADLPEELYLAVTPEPETLVFVVLALFAQLRFSRTRSPAC